MQKVREAPFAFPWRPSFYLLCFSYPPLSLPLSIYLHTHTPSSHLSLSLLHPSVPFLPPSPVSLHSLLLRPILIFPSSLSLSRVHGGVHGAFTQLAPRRWYRPRHPLQGCTSCQANHPPSTPFSLGNQPHPPRHYPSFPYYVVSPIVLLLLLLLLVLLLLLLLLLCAIRFIAGERA